jgi:hypothetical protein
VPPKTSPRARAGSPESNVSFQLMFCCDFVVSPNGTFTHTMILIRAQQLNGLLFGIQEPRYLREINAFYNSLNHSNSSLNTSFVCYHMLTLSDVM